MYNFMAWLASFLLVCNAINAEVNLDKFHVCTVATRSDVNLEKLKESCKVHNIELNVLGFGRENYPGHGFKLHEMLFYLSNLPDDDIVMFVDGFDVLIVSDKKVILEKFLETGESFIMAAEKNCFPYQEFAAEYPPSPTEFRYINTGTYIGYAKKIRKWIVDLHPNEQICDQKQATLYYIKNPNKRDTFALDYKCNLFLPLWGVRDDEVIIDKEKKSVFCKSTSSTPCVIHANGRSFRIWDKVYEQFFNHGSH